ncbi:MAG TPA: pyruvate formate lyase family protein, partial [Deltaproteobacteria bacterium]|nr:pyruvate formate lyase family protein [Deltaproteobacteria bacterium]
MERSVAHLSRDEETLKVPERFGRIRRALLAEPARLCIERALLVTEFFKEHDDPSEPMVVRKARALRYILRNKAVRIYPDELVVGGVGTHRRSVIIQPELAGTVMCQEILWMGRRRTNPYRVPLSDRIRLLAKVIPYWLTRNMAARAFGWYNPALYRYVLDQLNATSYLINEGGGIGHFVPGYDSMLKHGIEGFLARL